MDQNLMRIDDLFEMGLGARKEIIRENRQPDEVIGGDYMERYWVMRHADLGCIYVHRFLRSDRDELHDHPWDNLTVVLTGDLKDVGDTHRDILSRGTYIERRAEKPHRIELMSEEAWTLFVTGPKRRGWGFWPRDEDGQRYFVPWREYLNVQEEA